MIHKNVGTQFVNQWIVFLVFILMISILL